MPKEQQPGEEARKIAQTVPSRKPMQEVEIPIPEGCIPGDVFYAEVDGREFEVTMPEGSKPTDFIIMDLPADLGAGGNGISALPSACSTVRRYAESSNPRPTSSRRKIQTVEIPIPAGMYPGHRFSAEVGGRRFVVTVPEGAVPGDDIIMDLPDEIGLKRNPSGPLSPRRRQAAPDPESALARLKKKTVEAIIPEGPRSLPVAPLEALATAPADPFFQQWNAVRTAVLTTARTPSPSGSPVSPRSPAASDGEAAAEEPGAASSSSSSAVAAVAKASPSSPFQQEMDERSLPERFRRELARKRSSGSRQGTSDKKP